MCFPFSIKAQRFIVEGYFYLGGEMVEKKEGAIVADDAKEVKEPPTTEQQMETLQTQLKDVTVRAEKAESSVQGLRGSLTEKDTKIREQANLQAEIEDMKAMIKLTAFAQSQGVGLSEDDLGDTSKAEQPDVKKVWADLEQKREVAKEQDRQRVKADEYNRQALEVWDETLATGIEEHDDKAQLIYSKLQGGDLNGARLKLKSIEKSKDSKKETEEEIYERVKLEKEEGKGLFKSDTAISSGNVKSSWTPEEIEAMPLAEYEKVKPAVDKALQEGRIKK